MFQLFCDTGGDAQCPGCFGRCQWLQSSFDVEPCVVHDVLALMRGIAADPAASSASSLFLFAKQHACSNGCSSSQLFRLHVVHDVCFALVHDVLMMFRIQR